MFGFYIGNLSTTSKFLLLWLCGHDYIVLIIIENFNIGKFFTKFSVTSNISSPILYSNAALGVCGRAGNRVIQ